MIVTDPAVLKLTFTAAIQKAVIGNIQIAQLRKELT